LADPITIGLAGVSIGSRLLGGLFGNAAKKRQIAASVREAQRSSALQLSQLSKRAEQERTAAQLEAQTQREMSLAELGLVQAAAADSNVAGASVDAVTNTLKRKASIAQDITLSNSDAALDQLIQTALGVRLERDARIANARAGNPSGAATALDTLGFAAQTAIPLIRG
jgi:predicted dinucleotide-utilizing enzyme